MVFRRNVSLTSVAVALPLVFPCLGAHQGGELRPGRRVRGLESSTGSRSSFSSPCGPTMASPSSEPCAATTAPRTTSPPTHRIGRRHLEGDSWWCCRPPGCCLPSFPLFSRCSGSAVRRSRGPSVDEGSCWKTRPAGLVFSQITPATGREHPARVCDRSLPGRRASTTMTMRPADSGLLGLDSVV
jgi:hypothetical protein